MSHQLWLVKGGSDCKVIFVCAHWKCLNVSKWPLGLWVTEEKFGCWLCKSILSRQRCLCQDISHILSRGYKVHTAESCTFSVSVNWNIINYKSLEIRTGFRAASSIGNASTDVHAEHLPVFLMIVHSVTSFLCQGVEIKQMTWGEEGRSL